MKRTEIFFGILKIPTDFFLTWLAFALAYQIRSRTDLIPGIQLPVDLQQFQPWDQYLYFTFWTSLFLVIILAVNRMYSLRVTTRLAQEFYKILFFSLAWLTLLIAYFFLARELFFSRLVLAYSWILTVILITFGRIIIKTIQHYLLKKNIGRRRILFVGINEITQKLFQTLKNDLTYKIIGAVDDHPPQDTGNLTVLGTLDKLKYLVRRHHIEEIIQTKADLQKADDADILEFCRENHLQYSFVPDLLQVQRSNIEIHQVGALPLINLKLTSLDGWGKVSKRIFDLVAASIFLILLGPLMLIIALLIKLDSKGTILFKFLDDGKHLVKRVGQYSRLFYCYKFRTMKMNTHNLRYTELANQDIRKNSPMVKIKNDPRVTKIGRFLREFSLDELPQLINVIKGEMSLVGPRPHLPEEVAQYKKHQKFALALKPGITGLAQVSGRSDLDFEEEVKLDTYYTEHWSIWLDLKILLRTMFVVLSGKHQE